VDLAGAELLADLHATLLGQGIDFRLAGTHGTVREHFGVTTPHPAGSPNESNGGRHPETMA
jgi:hypothetical protein